MAHTVTSPEKFAEWFNAKVLGSYRQISADDIRDITNCGLIGKYSGWYIQLDIETVRAVLQYEQLRQNRQKRDDIRDSDGSIHCRRCGVVLTKPDGKRGRSREYCTAYESSRSTMRYRKWRRKKKAAINLTM